MPQGDSSPGVLGVALPLAEETDGAELMGLRVGLRQGFCSGSSSSSMGSSRFSSFSCFSSSSSTSHWLVERRDIWRDMGGIFDKCQGEDTEQKFLRLYCCRVESITQKAYPVPGNFIYAV